MKKSKIIDLILARINSSRFPGKPFANICGYHMIYQVYNQVKKVGHKVIKHITENKNTKKLIVILTLCGIITYIILFNVILMFRLYNIEGDINEDFNN